MEEDQGLDTGVPSPGPRVALGVGGKWLPGWPSASRNAPAPLPPSLPQGEEGGGYSGSQGTGSQGTTVTKGPRPRRGRALWPLMAFPPRLSATSFFISWGSSLAGPSRLHAPRSSQGVNAPKILLSHGCPRPTANRLPSRPLSRRLWLSPGWGRQVQTSFGFLDGQTDRRKHTARGPGLLPASVQPSLWTPGGRTVAPEEGCWASGLGRIEGRPLGSPASRVGDVPPSLTSLSGRVGGAQEAAMPLNLLTDDRDAW